VRFDLRLLVFCDWMREVQYKHAVF